MARPSPARLPELTVRRALDQIIGDLKVDIAEREAKLAENRLRLEMLELQAKHAEELEARDQEIAGLRLKLGFRPTIA
jgi:hypothetical protein